MGQKLFTDKIGTLQHNAGNIQLNASNASPSYLTIGGQQFKITTQLSVALPSMTANTRYQVYAVQSAGVVSLVISTNENSQGPTGYSGWKLVGSLISNNSSTFGAFFNITGVPKASYFAGTMNIAAVSGGASKGTTSADQIEVILNGSSVLLTYTYRQTAGGVAGTGDYLYSLPTNFMFPSSLPLFNSVATLFSSADAQLSLLPGTGWLNVGSSAGDGVPWAYAYSSSQFRIAGEDRFSTSNNLSSTYYALSQATLSMKISFWFTSDQFSDTAIEAR